MDWLQIAVLSLIQGITEFLPISSSAHLVLPSLLTDWPDQGLAFDVGVHFGSLLAVIFYFREELMRMAFGSIDAVTRQQYNPDLDMVLKLAVATLPVVVVGLLAKDFIEAQLRTLLVIACTTIGFGLLLWWSDRRPGTRDIIQWRDALIIGGAQVLALVPGTSRSGITITAALLVGISRVPAAHFSFLLSIPTILGAQLLLTLELVELGVDRWGELIAGGIIAGLSAYACIHLFIQLVERTGMLPYVIYRLGLGAVLLWFVFG